MNRLITLVILATGLGGFAVGWVAFSFNHSPATDESAAPEPVIHRFALSLADIKLDRETPAVAVDDRGRVVVAWAAEVSETERTLWLAHSEDAGKTFASPVAFRKVPVYRYVSRSKGKEVLRTSSVVPRLAAHGDTIYLAWTEAVAGGPRVVFQAARSDDGGKTFSAPVAVHGDEAGRPGFTALSAGAEGVLACAWLDHRGKAQLPFCSLSLPGGGKFQPEQLVHSRPTGEGICPCCDAAVVRAPDGTTFVAFRDNNEDYRDIRVSRARVGSGFEPSVAVTPDRWRIPGCPHDGPALAISGERLHVLWMDASTGRRRLYLASSGLGALQFTFRELQPETAGEQGHPRLAARADRLHAVWDNSQGETPSAPTEAHGQHHHAAPAGGSRAIFHTCSDDNGTTFRPAQPLAPREGSFQVNPALAVGSDSTVFVVWNELTEAGKSVVCVRVPAQAGK